MAQSRVKPSATGRGIYKGRKLRKGGSLIVPKKTARG